MKSLSIALVVVLFSNKLFAQTSTATTSVRDINGDGIVELVAFGDSITRGVGDNYDPGDEAPNPIPPPSGEAGYPLRLESWLGVNVANRGIPGERLLDGGVQRFTSVIGQTNADYVVISEGANDSFSFASSITVRKGIQTLINISKALGKEPVLAGIPPAMNGHAGLRPFIDSYNDVYADLADLNGITYGNTEAVFENSCTTDEDCYLLNLPDGLHPNTKGYDAMAEIIIAAMYGIDLLSPGGTTQLAQILGRPESQIVVKSPAATAISSGN